jgi:transposase
MSRPACDECHAVLHWRAKGSVCPRCRERARAEAQAARLEARSRTLAVATAEARKSEERLYRRMDRLKRSGKSVADIAACTKRSEATVKRWIRQCGPRHRRGETQNRSDRIPAKIEQALIDRAQELPILNVRGYADWVRATQRVPVSTTWVHQVLKRHGVAAEIHRMRPLEKELTTGVARLQASLDVVYRTMAASGAKVNKMILAMKDQDGRPLFSCRTSWAVMRETLRQREEREQTGWIDAVRADD